ncbi:TetR/AcrR family transcriptional regulator [Coraliomargarita sp. SDUM461004]|uniref:TetR/AcrR family transcriptional regulator n=1 Tax=Thalassobacterium sedimentorum TaxID=3041258 RepID=A0ABU1ANX3_9BACT|nr:TetR/AcrR family transcriptional regulator [Coraliomargarita sp. SDUM461004]MDQ8195903.1 TetR/AcrR family transcriptional regulator [Coraliomargarita sp. SDUM461004]
MNPSQTPTGSVSDKTRERILQAAGKIFAQGGYRAMTLREVTKEAGVNLASVNYHFGSKSNLMRELIHERFEPINQQRLKGLDQLVQKHAPAAVPLEAIFDALFRPLFAGIGANSVSDTTLVQIIGRMLTEPADFMIHLHKEFFAELSKRFMGEIQRTCPELSQEQIQFRFFLSISTMIGTIAGEVRLEIISGSQLNSAILDRILEELTNYVVAGFQQK